MPCCHTLGAMPPPPPAARPITHTLHRPASLACCALLPWLSRCSSSTAATASAASSTARLVMSHSPHADRASLTHGYAGLHVLRGGGGALLFGWGVAARLLGCCACADRMSCPIQHQEAFTLRAPRACCGGATGSLPPPALPARACGRAQAWTPHNHNIQPCTGHACWPAARQVADPAAPA